MEHQPAGGTFSELTAYSYDDDGLLLHEDGPDGRDRTWTRNAAGRATNYTQRTRRPDGSLDTHSTNLGWRPDGRILAEVANGVGSLYGYDDAGQLTAQLSTTNRTWAYGTRGNLTNSTVGAATTTHVTNPNGSIASSTTGTSTTTYTYDDAGRRTQARSTTDGTQTRQVDLAWTTAGRLGSIVNNGTGGNTWELRAYDGTNQKVKTLLLGGPTPVTTEHLWDQVTNPVPQVVGESVDGGTSWASTVFGPAGLIAEVDEAGTASWFQTDARGSVIEFPSNPDVVDGPTAYTPFGEPTPATAPTGATARGYRGEQTAAGLIHLRNRENDPASGQFLSRDPLDGVDGSTSVANAYRYADNNPLNQVDPLGLRARDADLECSAGNDLIPSTPGNPSMHVGENGPGCVPESDGWSIDLPSFNDVAGWFAGAAARVQEIRTGTRSPGADVAGATKANTEIRGGATPGGVCGTSARGIPIICVFNSVFTGVVQDADGFTLGHFVFCRAGCEISGSSGTRLLDHEFVHVDQFERWGDSFITMYLIEAAIGGRECDNRFEREAYQQVEGRC